MIEWVKTKDGEVVRTELPDGFDFSDYVFWKGRDLLGNDVLFARKLTQPPLLTDTTQGSWIRTE